MDAQGPGLGLARRLSQRLLPAAVLIAVFIGLAVPLTFYVRERQASHRVATARAEDVAESLARIVIDEPVLWKYQMLRFESALHPFVSQAWVASARVSDESGRLVIEVIGRRRASRPWWLPAAAVGSAPLVANNRRLGTVQVVMDDGHLLLGALGLLLGSTAVGSVLACFVYALPVAVVRRSEHRIEGLVAEIRQSNVQLEQRAVEQAAIAGEMARLYEEAQTRLVRMRRLGELSKLVNSSLDDEGEVLRRVTDAARELLRVDLARLWVVDEHGDAVRLLAETQHSEVDGVPMAAQLARCEGVAAWVLEHRETRYIADLREEPLFVSQDLLRGAGYVSALIAPMLASDHAVGTLAIFTRERREFGEEDRELLELFAAKAAIATQNARLHNAALGTVQRLRALVDVNRLLTCTLDHRVVAQGVVDAARRLVPDSACHLWELEPGAAELILLAEGGMRSPGTHPGRLPVGRGPGGTVAVTHEPIVCRDLRADPRVLHPAWFASEGLVSGIALPLLRAGVAYGALCLFTREMHEFDAEALNTLEMYASQLAATIANTQSFRREQERNRRLTTLSELTWLITSAGDSRQVFDAVAFAATTLLGARLARVLVFDRDTKAFRSEGAYSAEPELLSVRPDPLAQADTGGLKTKAFESRKPVYARDIQEGVDSPHARLFREVGLHAVAMIPLLVRVDALGVLAICFGEPRDFTAEEKQLMGLLADQAAIAIANKQREEKLHDLVAETEHLLASMATILVAIDREDRITALNRAAEMALGLPADRAVGRRLRECEIGWDWPVIQACIEEARARSSPTVLDDIRCARPDGRERILSFTVNPIESREHRTDFLLLGADVTEQRQLETQHAQTQKLESIGRLAAGIAHEINTPIQFVSDNMCFLDGAVRDLERLLASYQVLRDAATGPETAALVDEIRTIEREVDLAYLTGELPKAAAQSLDGVQRVASIVRALKEFAHPDRKERVVTDINRALQSTLAVARNEFKYVADVETDLAEIPLVACYPGELNQAFLNLIVNGAHAIADVVDASGTKGTIRIATRQEGSDVLIAISDTGGGIPEHIRSKIFDPFFTTKAVGRGTGQGLAIARSVVVDNHGGSLSFETQHGRGTTFTIRLPTSTEPNSPSRASRRESSGPGGGR